jgi:hypothetical protein
MKCLECVKENESLISKNKPGYNQGVCHRHNNNNNNNKIDDKNKLNLMRKWKQKYGVTIFHTINPQGNKYFIIT